MYRVLSKEVLAHQVARLWVDAPHVARNRRPAQFAIVRLDDEGERIPLTIADCDRARGAIAFVVQGVGKTTRELIARESGETILDVVGPLGKPTDLGEGRRVCCVGGGIGTAVVYPIACGVKATGGHVTSIVGARTRGLVILEEDLRRVMDAVRMALRLGALRAYLIYRRSRDEMPARREELEHTEEEGVELVLLTAPVAVLDDGHARVRALRCTRMALGESDGSGRRIPVPIPGGEFDIRVDTVVFAVGQGANPLIQSTTPDVAVTRRGTLVADEHGKTPKSGVFAGGDIVSGGATVISAMGAGRRAARAINEYLNARP